MLCVSRSKSGVRFFRTVGSNPTLSARYKPKTLKILGFLFYTSTCHQFRSDWEIVFRRLLCLAYRTAVSFDRRMPWDTKTAIGIRKHSALGKIARREGRFHVHRRADLHPIFCR